VLLNTLYEVPTQPVQIAEGVRWSVESNAGFDELDPTTAFPAGVLETANDRPGKHTSYSVRVFKKERKRELQNVVIVSRERRGRTFDAEVSERFPEADQLDRIEIYRLRFASAQVANVRIRNDLDLMPQRNE